MPRKGDESKKRDEDKMVPTRKSVRLSSVESPTSNDTKPSVNEPEVPARASSMPPASSVKLIDDSPLRKSRSASKSPTTVGSPAPRVLRARRGSTPTEEPSSKTSVGRRRASSERSVSPTNSDKSDVVAGRTRSRRSLIPLEVITEIQSPGKNLGTPRGKKSRRTSTLESSSSLQSINEDETAKKVDEKKDKKQTTDTKEVNLDEVYEILRNYDDKENAEKNANDKIEEVLNSGADVPVNHSIKAVEVKKCLEESANSIELKTENQESISCVSSLVKISSHKEPETSIDKMSENVEDGEQKNTEKFEREKLLSNLGLNKGEKFYKETKVHIHRMENIFPMNSSSPTGKLDVAVSNSKTSPENAAISPNKTICQNESDQISSSPLQKKTVENLSVGAENSNNIVGEAALSSKVEGNVIFCDESKGIESSMGDIKVDDKLHTSSKVLDEINKSEDNHTEDVSHTEHINMENLEIKEPNDAERQKDSDHVNVNSSEVDTVKVKHSTDENGVMDNKDVVCNTPKSSEHVEAVGTVDATSSAPEHFDCVELKNKLPEESGVPENTSDPKSLKADIPCENPEEVNSSDVEKMQVLSTQNDIEKTTKEVDTKTVDHKLRGADTDEIVREKKTNTEVEINAVSQEAHQTWTEKCVTFNQVEQENKQEVSNGDKTDIDRDHEEKDCDQENVGEKVESLNVTTPSEELKEMSFSKPTNVDDVPIVENKVVPKEKSLVNESTDITVQDVRVENQPTIEANVKDCTMECELAVPLESRSNESNDGGAIEQISSGVEKDPSLVITTGQDAAGCGSNLESQVENVVCSEENPTTFKKEQLANTSVTNVETDESVDEDNAVDITVFIDDVGNGHSKKDAGGEKFTAQLITLEDNMSNGKKCGNEIYEIVYENVQTLEILPNNEPDIEDGVAAKNADEDTDKKDELVMKSKTDEGKKTKSVSRKEIYVANVKSYKPLPNMDSDADSVKDESVSDGESCVKDFIDGEAEEGEEDTPSENSNDIPVKGEILYSDSSRSYDSGDTYSRDSFIVDDIEFDTGDMVSSPDEEENKKKKGTKRKRVITFESTSSSDDESGATDKADGTNYVKDKKVDNHGKNTSSANKNDDGDENDLEEMDPEETTTQTKPFVITDVNNETSEKKVQVFKESLSSGPDNGNDIILIEDENHDSNVKEASIITVQEANVKANISSQSDNDVSYSEKIKSGRSSINITENITVDEIQDGGIKERLSDMVDWFCKSLAKKNKIGNISLNVSLNYEDSNNEDRCVYEDTKLKESGDPEVNISGDMRQGEVPNESNVLNENVEVVDLSEDDEIVFSSTRNVESNYTNFKQDFSQNSNEIISVQSSNDSFQNIKSKSKNQEKILSGANVTETATICTPSKEQEGGEIAAFVKEVKDQFKKRKVPLTTILGASINLDKFEEENENIELTEPSHVECAKSKRQKGDVKMAPSRSKKMKKEKKEQCSTEQHLQKKEKESAEMVPKLKKRKRNELRPSEPMAAVSREEKRGTKIMSKSKRSKKEIKEGRKETAELCLVSNQKKGNTEMKRKRRERKDQQILHDYREGFQSPLPLENDDVFELSETYIPTVENEKQTKRKKLKQYTCVKSDSECENNVTKKSTCVKEGKFAAYNKLPVTINLRRTGLRVLEKKPNPKVLNTSWEKAAVCKHNVEASDAEGWMVEDNSSQTRRNTGSDWSVVYNETPVKPSKRNPRADNKRKSDTAEERVPIKKSKICSGSSRDSVDKDFKNRLLYVSRKLRVATKKIMKQKSLKRFP